MRVVIAGAALVALASCGLDEPGLARPGTDGGAALGGGGTTVSGGGSWSTGGSAPGGGTAGVGGTAGAGGTAGTGIAGAPAGGAAGAAGSGGTAGGVATGGTGGFGGSCAPVGAGCSDPLACCSGKCGPSGADPKDCNTQAKCAECTANWECTSGRCDGCACLPLVLESAACDEDGDCQGALCGPAGADPKDCNTQAKCAGCRANWDCTSGRCDGCHCLPQAATGAACDENSDCLSDKCGPNGADPKDCNTQAKCAECTANWECGSGRCDGCNCAPVLVAGSACDENSDCQNNDCGTNSKCK